MGKLIVNANFEWDDIEAQGIWTPTDSPNEKVVYVPVPSFVNVCDSPCVGGVLSFIVPAGSCELSGYDHLIGGGAVIGTAQNKINDVAFVVEGDTGECACVFKLKTTPFTLMAGKCKFTIKTAGQEYVTTD